MVPRRPPLLRQASPAAGALRGERGLRSVVGAGSQPTPHGARAVSQVDRLVEFAQSLRAAGLRPGTGAVEDFCRASALVGVRDLYWAGRATLVSRRDDIPVYDSVFAAYFSGSATMPVPKRSRLRLVTPRDDRDGEGEAGGTRAPRAARASRIELLRKKRFEHCTPGELAELATLAESLARSLPARRSRRRERARRGALNLRSTLRSSLRTGGEPFERGFHNCNQVVHGQDGPHVVFAEHHWHIFRHVSIGGRRDLVHSRVRYGGPNCRQIPDRVETGPRRDGHGLQGC